jgi:hypothetical protein
MRPPRPQTLLLVLLAVSLALRLWLSLPNPGPTRFWDERFGAENVVAFLGQPSLTPANGYHPSLSYLPQALVLAGVEWVAPADAPVVERPADGRPRLAATGYRLSRLLVVLYGVFSLWLLYRIGSLIFDPATGVLAGLLLAIVPWHLRQSAIFKPDMLLVATTLLALWASLLAVRRRTLGGWLAAGAAIGLALASKFNAAPAALPLAVGVALQTFAPLDGAHRPPGVPWARVRDLALAAGAALVVFLLIDPWMVTRHELFTGDFGQTVDHYEDEAGVARASHWSLPLHAIQSLLGRSFHGPWLGALALAALAVSLWPAARRDWSPDRRLGWWMLVSYVVAYVALYSAATANPSPHNWLVLAPITALALAWGLRTAIPALPAGWPRWLAVAAASVLIGERTVAFGRECYALAVPTTAEVAEAALRRDLEPLAGRILLSEVDLQPQLAGHAVQARTMPTSGGLPLVVATEQLTALPADEVELADGLIFPADRLTDTAYAARILGRQTATITPAAFRRRGPALVVATRLLVAVGQPGFLTPPAAGDGRYPLAAPSNDTVLSLDVSLPIAAVPRSALKPPPRVDVRVELAGGELLDCLPRRSQLRVLRCLTPRFHVGPGAVLVVTGAGTGAATGPPVIRTQAWRGGPSG